MNFCYVIQSLSKQEYFYKGFCKNLEARLKEHNAGKTKSNKAYLPFKIIYFETFNNLEEALKLKNIGKLQQEEDICKIKFWSRSSMDRIEVS